MLTFAMMLIVTNGLKNLVKLQNITEIRCENTLVVIRFFLSRFEKQNLVPVELNFEKDEIRGK